MYKTISMIEALEALKKGKQVYTVSELTMDSTLREFDEAGTLMTLCDETDDEEPDQEEEADGDLIHDEAEADKKLVSGFMQKFNKEEKKPINTRIDYGKVYALHRAGWSNPKIADECKCTGQAVRNIIKRIESDPSIIERLNQKKDPADVAASTESRDE